MKTITITNVAFSLLLLSACGGGGDKAQQLEALKKEQAALSKKIAQLETELAGAGNAAISVKAKEVTVTELTPRPFDHYIQTQGKVESMENILVSAKMMGIVTSVYARAGEAVAKGQTLAQIDNSVIVRSIEELKSGLELANTVYERQKNLWDQKIGTEIQFLQAKNQKESLEKRLATLNEQNEMSKIKAPVSGTVDEVFVKLGENVAPGMPAVRVVNSADLKVKLDISESFVTTVKKGDKSLISLPDMKTNVVATVTFVGRSIDALSRTFPVEIKLPGGSDVRPNMTAVVKVVYESFPQAIVVPVNVIQNINGEKVVYVAETNGTTTVARKRVVKVAGVFDNQAQVSKGLAKGDRLITFGYQGLNDGEAIKI
jgi:RND family efflux transporter MFP subunit